MMNYALLLLALKTWSLLHNCIGVHATTIQKSTYSFDDVSSFPIHRNGNYEELMKRTQRSVEHNSVSCVCKGNSLPCQLKSSKEKCCHFTKLNHDNLTWGFCLGSVHEGNWIINAKLFLRRDMLNIQSHSDPIQHAICLLIQMRIRIPAYVCKKFRSPLQPTLNKTEINYSSDFLSHKNVDRHWST